MDKNDVEKMRKVASAIYLVADETVAKDISEMLIKAADHIDWLEGQLATLEPVDAILASDCDEGSDKRYGRVLIATEGCIQRLYRLPVGIAKAEEIDNDQK